MNKALTPGHSNTVEGRGLLNKEERERDTLSQRSMIVCSTTPAAGHFRPHIVRAVAGRVELL